jgi:hypothetical protein
MITCIKQALFVNGRYGRFATGQKRRAHLHRLCTSPQCPFNISPRHKAAGSNHRNVHCSHDLRQQLVYALLGIFLPAYESAAMAARFDARSNHRVGAAFLPG